MTTKTSTPDFSDWSLWALQIAVVSAMGSPKTSLETVNAMLQEIAKRREGNVNE